jgi:FKBP-type peptidyl-prolyl cis-trans isomerase
MKWARASSAFPFAPLGGRSRYLIVICAFLTAAALSACGTSGSSSNQTEGQSSAVPATHPAKSPETNSAKPSGKHLSGPADKRRLAMSKAEIAKLPKVKFKALNGPPPKKLVVRDIRKGWGAAVRPNDAILVDFFDVKYGETSETPPTRPYGPTRYGLTEVVKGWTLGLPGMRVGGRRELIVPPKLGYKDRTVVYVIDLLAVYPGEAGEF